MGRSAVAGIDPDALRFNLTQGCRLNPGDEMVLLGKQGANERKVLKFRRILEE